MNKKSFEELDYRDTPIGALSLRRRFEPRIGDDVFEIKLDDEFLMSSIITCSEIALARLAIEALDGETLEVAVGGLGLGYTARAVLQSTRVRSLVVVDYLGAVIDWHTTGLLPLGHELTADQRCKFIEGDFFASISTMEGLDPDKPQRRFNAILVDIDHSPDALLDDRSGSFYTQAGFSNVARHLAPGGIFGLWSDDRPDPVITDRLGAVFAQARAEPITFDVPMRDQPFTQTVYIARKAA